MNWEWPRSWFTVLWCISCCAIVQKYNSKLWSAWHYPLLQEPAFWTNSLTILGMIPCSWVLLLISWGSGHTSTSTVWWCCNCPRSLSRSLSWRGPNSNAIPQSLVRDHDCFHWKEGNVSSSFHVVVWLWTFSPGSGEKGPSSCTWGRVWSKLKDIWMVGSRSPQKKLVMIRGGESMWKLTFSVEHARVYSRLSTATCQNPRRLGPSFQEKGSMCACAI